MLYTVAYPQLPPEASEFVAQYRQVHDLPYRDVVAAHFTLVFGCEGIPESEYLQHVGAVAAGWRRIEFVCRYAMLGADAEEEVAYVFLVPDEGHSAISLLHDHLYTGPLSPHLRLDIPFTPHLSIATLENRREAKRLCDELNGEGFVISGALDSVTVGALVEAGRFKDLASFALQE